MVIKRGTDITVTIQECRRLKQAARPRSKELLLAQEPRAKIPVPQRGKRRRRAPANF